MKMEGIEGEHASNVGQGETPSDFPQFVVHDKPPPSYEESQQQQQHGRLINEVREVSEADKLAIYRHPLFPLLAMLFDKCEWATCSQEGPNSQQFQNEIRSFLLHLGQDGKSLLSGNDDTDSLMVKAILVLKIHLLEIEKVNELCKDFCQRYIACLKGKLQTENMLGIFSSGCDDDVAAGMSNDSQLSQLQGSLAFLSQSSSNGVSCESLKKPSSPSTNISNLPSMVLPTTNQNSIFGSIDAPYKSPLSGTNQGLRTVPLDSSSPSPPNKKAKRSILPKHATNTMKAWLFQHIAHPYPSEEEKRILAHQTDLSLLQVNNWFINARRRILQPMLESSNSENSCRTKKSKPNQARLTERFWPDSLVQTIQNGSSNSLQLSAQQAVHGVPIAVVSNNNQLISTPIPIQCVQSDKLPLLRMLSCPTQTLHQTELSNENNNVLTANIVGICDKSNVVAVTNQEIIASASPHHSTDTVQISNS